MAKRPFYERKGGAAVRFAALVNKTSTCWLWVGTKARGYGCFRMHGKQTRAHRASWVLYRGPVPEGQYVLHRCDNPACVNPEHLFLGTQYDNMRDCRNKGRLRPGRANGARHGRAKLSAEDVRDIRSLAELGWTQREIGVAYGVHKMHVGKIVRGELWASSV